jgi:processive 1,2-diacylglycerol beta-glucosyltransferase
MNKRILILHTSVGLGHKFIAQNIAWHLEQATSLASDTWQAGFEVKLADIGQVQKGKFEHIVVGVHQFINKHLPFVWAWIYAWGHYIVLPFRVFIAGFNYKSTKALVDEFHPDLIITTQTAASAVVAYLKKQKLYQGLFGIAFSDFHLHPYWLYNQADFYLVNTEEQKQEMLRQNIATEKIYICGITLKPKADVGPANIRRKLGIADKDRVILVGTGSLGLGFKEKDLSDLAKIMDIKIIFACGKNQELLEHIKNLKCQNIIALGFYEPMDELYSIADIFIGKPGGLSTAESLRWHLPLLVAYTLPGQEDLNLKFLSEKNLIIPRPKDLVGAVENELRTCEFKNQLLKNPHVGEIVGREGVLVDAVSRRIG